MLLYTQRLPLGIPGQWVWRLRPITLTPGQGSVLALAAALLSALVVLEFFRRGQVPTRGLCAVLLTIIILLGMVTALGIVLDDVGYWVRAPLVVVSDVSMGYYQQAVRLSSIAAFLGAHCNRTADLKVADRVRTHPPGPVLLVYAIRSCLVAHPSVLTNVERILQGRLGLTAQAIRQVAGSYSAAPLSPLDALIALLVALILSVVWVLLAVPAFGIGAVLFDRRVGLVMALLAVGLPSLLYFSPGIDGLGAVLATSFVYLWLLALKSGWWGAYLLAGAAAAVMLMWSFGFLILGVIALVTGVGQWRQAAQSEEIWPHARGLVICGATLILPYVALYLWSGYNLLLALPASLAAHHQILSTWGRSYGVWVPMNLYDFLLFMGPALVVVSAAALYHALASGQWSRLGRNFIYGLLVTLLLLLISGSTRGEVGRIWVFLMPLTALPAAHQLAQLREGKLLWTGATVIALQVGFAIVLCCRLSPIMPY